MAWDLDTAYARTGLTQSPQNDALLTGTMAASLALVEMWLNRKLAFATDVEAVAMAYLPNTLTLRRYPLTKVTSVTYRNDQMDLPLGLPDFGNSFPGRFIAEADTGLLYFPGGLSKNEVLVSYEGGYEEFPSDLELALWLVFDQILPSMSGGDGGGSSLGAVESITVPDVGTVRFATSAAISAADGSAGGDYNPNIPLTAQALLNPYRREYA